MNENLKKATEQLGKLVEALGLENVENAVRQVLAGGSKLPAEVLGVISPDRLAWTAKALDDIAKDYIDAGQARDAAYRDKGDLVKRMENLENDLKITEANLFMKTKYDDKGKAYVDDPAGTGERLYLTNDTARDNYRRYMTQDLRRQISEVSGDLKKIEVELDKAKDTFTTVVEAAGAIRAKAAVQAALLNFLAK